MYNKLLICLFVIAIIIHNNLVNCGYLDLTDIDDPLALLWNTKAGIEQFKSEKCTIHVDGTEITGECKHYTHCILTGGRPSGLCGILSTCCIYDTKTCSKTTNNRISYFESGLSPVSHTDCTYTIQRSSNNVCQARLDFELFDLTEPTEATGIDPQNPGSSFYFYDCSIDYLQVTPNPFNKSIPKLCGHNTQQHLYVHWDQAIKQVELSIHLGSRFVYNTAIRNPQWRIRVTQLECPHNWNFIKHDNHLMQDYPYLAPPGIIQYFTETSGRIRSFNLDPSRVVSQRHSFTTWSNYGIAIKRRTTDCQVTFTNSYLFLPSNDVECSSYLFIPGLQIDPSAMIPINNNNKYELCTLPVAAEAITVPITFSMKTNGPFYLEFVTNVQTGSRNDLGFDIEYNVVSCN